MNSRLNHAIYSVGLDSLIKNMRSNSDALEHDIVQNRKQNDSLISDTIKFDEG